jgi:hypothetical protein
LRPDWGRGRIDPFNPVKFRMLRQPIDDTIGNSDMVPVWAMARRNGQAYHWDGLNTSLREVVLSSALGDGATKQWGRPRPGALGREGSAPAFSLRRITDYLLTAPIPKYPYAVDRALAQTGAGVWADRLCRVPRARRPPHRHDHSPGRGRHRSTSRGHVDQVGRHLRTTRSARGAAGSSRTSAAPTGYVGHAARRPVAHRPFLHNGSVPSLADLLEPWTRGRGASSAATTCSMRRGSAS